ncbi:MAG: hypothetical protein NVS3B25_19170 [Hymenobacter sp.]
MPDKNPARSIKGTMPTGSYAGTTRASVQGKGSNKTEQYLAAIGPNHPGQQAFYREALTVPHPLQPGASMRYGELQDLLAGPQRGAALDAYAAAHRLPTATAAQMQQALFDQGHADLLARAAQHPGEYAFPPAADAALRAPVTATGIAHGNFEQPAAGQLQNAAALSQRFADLPTGQGAYVAPGMAAPQPAPARRVIRGAAPAIASN